MDGFDEKIQKILNDPGALASIAQFAKGLNLNQNDTTASPEAHAEKKSAQEANSAPGGLGGITEILGDIDPKMLRGLGEIMGELQGKDDRRIALLSALKPYVRAERRSKMDRAAQIVTIAKAMRRGWGILGGGS
ncbi:MAG: hypothetical protein FWH04_03720 [Oscillospiraceae bacterium]|nr:hypothetical protein [Oscillospiraceae bacterium]